MDKTTMFLTQVIMTFMMATTMSGIISLTEALWLSSWLKSALIAWPIAFVLDGIAFPTASCIAHRLRSRGISTAEA